MRWGRVWGCSGKRGTVGGWGAPGLQRSRPAGPLAFTGPEGAPRGPAPPVPPPPAPPRAPPTQPVPSRSRALSCPGGVRSTYVSEFVPLPGALVVLRHGGEPLSVIQEIPSVRPPGGRRQRQSRAAPGGCAHTQHRHLEHLRGHRGSVARGTGPGTRRQRPPLRRSLRPDPTPARGPVAREGKPRGRNDRSCRASPREQRPGSPEAPPAVRAAPGAARAVPARLRPAPAEHHRAVPAPAQAPEGSGRAHSRRPRAAASRGPPSARRAPRAHLARRAPAGSALRPGSALPPAPAPASPAPGSALWPPAAPPPPSPAQPSAGPVPVRSRPPAHLPLQTRCGPSEGGGPAPAVLRVLAPPLGSAPPVRQAVSAPRLPHGTERRARSGAPPSRSPRADGQTREARPGETLRVAGQRCPALASRKPPAPSSAPGRALGRVWETGFRPGKVKSVCANFWLPRCANFPVDGWKLFPVPFLKSGSFLGGKLEHT